MNISGISDYVWNNCVEYAFGEESEWQEDLFLADWAKRQGVYGQWRELKEGWYWFCAKTTYRDLHDLEKPSSLPDKGCDFGLVTHENQGVFCTELLCKQSEDKWLVVYNGHQENIKRRVRSHFVLNNNDTGALGLRHYPVSAWPWKIRMFSISQIDEAASPEIRRQIELLIGSKSGRRSVESAWRVKNGWPVLCKE